jgi:hypothetical protein
MSRIWNLDGRDFNGDGFGKWIILYKNIILILPPPPAFLCVRISVVNAGGGGKPFLPSSDAEAIFSEGISTLHLFL